MTENKEHAKENPKSRLFVILGGASLVLAYIGVAMPGIPGTPFILLTAFFFVRSNKRMYNWVLKHKLFGKIIRDFQKNEKVPLKFKIFVAVQLWISIGVARWLFIETLWVEILVYTLGSIATIFIFRLKNTSAITETKSETELRNKLQ